MLLFLDSFDHYPTAEILQKWDSLSVATSQSISAGTGRRGTNNWQTTTSRSLTKSIAGSPATLVVGFAYQISALPAAIETFSQLLEGATVHISLRLNPDGSLVIARNTTTLGTSAAGVISAGVYNYIEYKATIHDTTGSYEVMVNGVSVLSGSGADTRNGGTGVLSNVIIIGVAGRTNDFDDLYICDTTGSANNDFLGDVRVDAYFPSGNGNSSDLVGSDSNSVDNYLLVDEASVDGDTTYVQSDVVSDHDTYAFGNMAHTPSDIFGVQVVASAKKDDAGARSIATVTRSNGADTDGATQALSTSYLMYREILEEDPDTSAAWIKAGFDAAEFGVKVAA